LSVSNQEIQFACFGDVDVGHDVVANERMKSVNERLRALGAFLSSPLRRLLHHPNEHRPQW